MSPKSIQRVAAAAAAANASSLEASRSSTPPSPLSTTSYASSSSPSLAASSPDSGVRVEDDRFSLAETAAACAEGDYYSVQFEEAAWYNFDSPKYNEMLNGAFFDPSMVEDYCSYEDGDIRLWSFC